MHLEALLRVLLDVDEQARQVVAVIDHCCDRLVVCFFESEHVSFLVDPLQFRVLRVVNYQHHHLRLVYQNLQPLKAEFVRVVVNVKYILLVDGFFLIVQLLTLLLLVQKLNHVFGVYKRPKIESCCIYINL